MIIFLRSGGDLGKIHKGQFKKIQVVYFDHPFTKALYKEREHG